MARRRRAHPGAGALPLTSPAPFSRLIRPGARRATRGRRRTPVFPQAIRNGR